MTADPSPNPLSPLPSRPWWQTVILWVCKLAAAGILGTAGVLKLMGNEADIALFTELDMEPFGRHLIGALEAGAAALMLIRQSTVYGAFLGLGLMCGALIAELTALEAFHHLELAILVAMLCLVILYIRRRDAPFIGNLIDW